ncbi:MAB_1171c family putative transporter [Streptomyces sp. NPDC020875]|uniref:MAB_1171c family putative transporter n=1 Tax=Streptomyces sp. NPDC020875 TaxID=3154898 RepID=UPI0033E5981C
MTAETAFAVPAGVLLVATLIKVADLARNPRDVFLRSTCAVLAVAFLVFATGAPPMLAAVNRLTGVPNIAAPIVYCILTAFSGSSIVLLIHWRDGDTAATRRSTRLCLGTYAAVAVAIWVLFALGDAPVERLRDLDTYYASTPFIREMILLYLLAHTVAAVTMTLLCWRWSRQVSGALRAGLLTIAAGSVLAFGYDVLKTTAIGARWTGHDLDWLSTQAAFAVAGVSAVLIGIGFLVPTVGQGLMSRWHTGRRYHALRPLWNELRPEIPPASAAPLPWWSPPDLRLLQRERDIHDALLRLAPHCDRTAGERAYHSALDAGRSPAASRLEADAAVVTAAMIAKTRTTPPLSPPDRWTVESAANAVGLIRLSLVVRYSPLVAKTRRGRTSAHRMKGPGR